MEPASTSIQVVSCQNCNDCSCVATQEGTEMNDLAPSSNVQNAPTEKKAVLGIFEKYLTVWVALCIIVGVILGYFVPAIPDALAKATVAQVSIPVAVLIWVMILPMMMNIDFKALKNVGKNPKGLVVVCVSSFLIKPFTMYAISLLFFRVIFRFLSSDTADEYIAGNVILAGAPCTAMVFCWSLLVSGDPAYTLVQVAINDLIMLGTFVPTVKLLLGVSSIFVPWDTIIFSVLFFVVVPLVLGTSTRWVLNKKFGTRFVEAKVLPVFKPITIIGLLATLVLIFIFQGENIVEQPLHILLIAVPQIIQNCLNFAIVYLAMYILRIPFSVGAPGALIGASNFFELAVAVAIAVFGIDSGATVATVVGVLVEVPLMLILVWVCNRSAVWYRRRSKEHLPQSRATEDVPTMDEEELDPLFVKDAEGRPICTDECISKFGVSDPSECLRKRTLEVPRSSVRSAGG